MHVWSATSLDKIKPDTVPCASLHREPSIRLSAARGEVEAAQLCLRSEETATEIVRVETLPLRCGSVEIMPRVRRVDYVKVIRPSHGDGEPGLQPDPLLPFTPFTLTGTRSLWIDVHVPREAPAGTYEGAVVVCGSGGKDVRIPLTLRVYDFALPWPPRLVTGFGLYEKPLRRRYGEQYKRMFRLFRENMAAHRITHLAFPASDIPVPDVTVRADGSLKIEYAAFDQAVEKNIRLGMNQFEMPLPARYVPKEKRLESPFSPATLVRILSDFERHLEERGWLNMAYLFLVDEPERDAFDVFRQIQELLKQGAPNIRRRLDMGYGAYGARPGQPIKEAEYRKLKGWVEIWVPHIDCVDQEFLSAEQAEGRDVWWYICCSAKHPYPNCLIDYPLLDSRVPLWMAFDAGVSGFVYWTVNWWNDDPFGDPLSFANANGDGMLLYPGADGPMDSIRWEAMRDGFEDYEYLVMLADRIREAEVTRRSGTPLIEARAALRSIKEVAASRTEYTQDPFVLLHTRNRVAQALETLLQSS